MSTTGCSASECIEQIKQSEDDYIPLRLFEVVPVDDDNEYAAVLNPKENVRSDLINTAVDHMTRFGLGLRAEEAFARSLSNVIMPLNVEARGLISGIKYLNDDNSIISALKLSEFDHLRWGEGDDRPFGEGIDPDEATIENVSIMVERSCRFFGVCVPNLPDAGFMTFDTLWDLSTSEVCPTKEQTLRLLIEWREGLRWIHAGWFRNIRYLGICNPRLNEAYRIKVDDISQDVIDAVDRYMLGCSE